MSRRQIPTWDQYIGFLMDRGYVSSAAICPIKDGKRWSASAMFDVSQAEVQAIAEGFEDCGVKLRLNGLRVGCLPFTLTHVNNSIMVGRNSASCSGVVIYKCYTCFVICVYDKGCAGGCFAIVRRVGDFLKNRGF